MRKEVTTDAPDAAKAHMVTTTLYLRPDQWDWLMRIKQETDAPVAAIIRRAIDAAMGKK